MAWGTDKLLSRIYMQNISYSHHHHHQPPPQDLYGDNMMATQVVACNIQIMVSPLQGTDDEKSNGVSSLNINKVVNLFLSCKF